jgi:predicted dehydrogenase
VYLLGKPDRVAGSVMQAVYSRDVDDIVTSTLTFDGRFSGTIHMNWSDEAYRKPTNIIRVFGTKGKIFADKHAYRIYLKEDRADIGFHRGWNTHYVTEFAKSVRFYLRGNEFTRQLDHFVETILAGANNNRSSFNDAIKTDIVMDEIIRDSSALSVPTIANGTSQTVPATAPKKSRYSRN